MYPSYLAKVNQRLAVPSNFTIAVNGFNVGLNYTVMVTMEMVEPFAGGSLVLQFAVTESHIPENWGGLTEVNHVERTMVPGSNGTQVNFSTQNIQTVMLNFALNANWNQTNIDFVAFIQNNTTKEILQGFTVPLEDLMPMTNYNAGCMEISKVPVTNCTGNISPQVKLINQGAQALTSVSINYRVNNETVNTFLWTGNLNYGISEMVTLPVANFALQDNNELIIYTTNPNGNPDEDTSNDTITSTFVSAMEVVPNVYVFIKLDDHPEQTTWECKNSGGEVLFSGGPYANAQAFIKDTLFLGANDCYTFIIYDSGGDGLIGENAGFTLRQNNFSLLYENNNFENSEEQVQFAINQTGLPVSEQNSDFTVYPNPFGEYTFVSFSLLENETVDLTIYNVIGKVVYRSQETFMEAGYQKLMINTKGFVPGIYFVNLKTGDKTFVRKISSF